MPRLSVHPILSVPNLKLISTYYETGCLFHKVLILEKPKCTKCQAKGKNLRLKDSFERTIQHELVGEKRSYLKITQRKFLCRRCDTYFREPIPAVLPFQRASEHARYLMARDHHLGFSKSTVADRYNVSSRKVDRQYAHLQARHLKELSQRSCPKVMGIDEHFLNRKVGFVTTFVNLQTHKVFDLAPGRSELSLRDYLEKLKGKENVRVVVMDLSSTYRSIIQKYFPNALIVADRFHVIRHLNHQLLNIWKKIDPNGRSNRGLLSLVRRHRFNLKHEQRLKLVDYFSKVPALSPVYSELKALQELLLNKHKKQSEVRKFLIPKLLGHIARLEECAFEESQSLAKLIKSWLEPIARMWRFTKTNSITEGLHCKMELLQRIAFGFHSFKNYRIRVLAHCG